MKHLLFLVFPFLIGCGREASLPEGVSIRSVDTGDVIVTLDKSKAVMVRQNKEEDMRTALVSYLNGELHVIQLEAGGATPRSMELISADTARFTSHSKSLERLVIDEDGDGIPEIKIEGSKKFVLGEIVWKEAESSSAKPNQAVDSK